MLYGGGPQKVPQAQPDPPAKPDKVFLWRKEVLERAGYDDISAELIASDRHVDLHRAVDMRKQGCHVATALLILL